MDTQMMDILRDNAFAFAAKWRWDKIHEEDVKRGRVVYYLLPPPEGWLVYLAASMLAGIVGGLSYDAMKKLISSIRDRFREQFKREFPEEEFLQRFYDDLKEYYFSKQNRSSPISKAYLKGLANGMRLQEEAKQAKKMMKLESYLKKIMKNKGYLQ